MRAVGGESIEVEKLWFRRQTVESHSLGDIIRNRRKRDDEASWLNLDEEAGKAYEEVNEWRHYIDVDITTLLE